MALSLITIMVGSAFIAAALTLHAMAQCKQASGRMLEQYGELLAEARRANREKEEREKEKEKKREADVDGAARPPPSTDA